MKGRTRPHQDYDNCGAVDRMGRFFSEALWVNDISYKKEVINRTGLKVKISMNFFINNKYEK